MTDKLAKCRVPRQLRLQTRQGNLTRCEVCRFRCSLLPGAFGLCGAVLNTGGTLVWLNYGRVVVMFSQKIDKAALLHYKPDSKILILGSFYCNFGCKFCPTWPLISKSAAQESTAPVLSPREVIEAARHEGVSGICFQINEPTVCLDFILDLAPLIKQAGFYLCLHSNGYMTPEAIALLAQVTDAICISLKGFGDPLTYRHWIRSQPDPRYVFHTIKTFFESGVHTEVLCLLLREYCRLEKYAKKTASWLAFNVSPDIPMVLTQMLPVYKPSWNQEGLFSEREGNKLAEICRESGLRYVYNWAFLTERYSGLWVTYCPGCGYQLVSRRMSPDGNAFMTSRGFQPNNEVRDIGSTTCKTQLNLDASGKCPQCGTGIYGIWA